MQVVKRTHWHIVTLKRGRVAFDAERHFSLASACNAARKDFADRRTTLIERQTAHCDVCAGRQR